MRNAIRSSSAGLDVPGIGADFVADWEALARWAADQVPTTQAREREQTERGTPASRAAVAAGAGARRGRDDVRRRRAAPPGADRSRTLRELAAAAESRATAEAKRIADGIKESAEIDERGSRTARDDDRRGPRARAAAAIGPIRAVGRQRSARVVGRRRIRDARAALEQSVRARRRRAATSSRSSITATPTSAARPRRSPAARPSRRRSRSPWRSPIRSARSRPAAPRSSTRSSSTKASARSTPTASTPSPRRLETLGGDARMVGIVTHVRDLADRVPVRFEVTKGPRTSSVTRVDA